MQDPPLATDFAPAASARQERRRAEVFPTVAAMVITALLVRLVTMLFMYPDHLDPKRNHWRFAWEMGMVARSIATGKGFSSPFVGETGPTAWFPPVYPYLLAGIFKIFGLFSKASAIAILSFNCICSALTCWPIFCIARRTIGERVARTAGWIWVFFPYAIWVASGRIWENALTTLLLSLLIWLSLLLDEGRHLPAWIGYGILWGIAALTNPTVLAVLPFLLLWIAWRHHRTARAWFVPTAVTALMIIAVVTPWTIRNYRVFHKFMPLRSNFWMEVRVGNTGDISDIYPDWAHPSTSAAQWNELHKLGEVAFMREMRELAVRFIRENPSVFGWLTWKRIVFTWTGFWSLEPEYARGEPFQLPNTFFCSTLTVLGLMGLAVMWRHRREWIVPYVAVLGAYPAVYYITHPSMDYRHAIDPMLVILVAYAVQSFVVRRRKSSLALDKVD